MPGIQDFNIFVTLKDSGWSGRGINNLFNLI